MATIEKEREKEGEGSFWGKRAKENDIVPFKEL
jgi:hypothetical protein